MTDISFYHLTSTPLDRALPKLLEKSLQAGLKTCVKFGSEEKAEAMNNLLWTYNPDSFLPHGTAKDGNSALQPIYLTAGSDNPNQAALLMLTDGSGLAADASVTRVFDIFDGTDEVAVAAARERYKNYREAGHTVSYIRQTDSGGWEKA